MITEAYLIPETLEQCLEALESYRGEASIIAGGTDFMLALKEKKIAVQAIVDITRIPELLTLEFRGDSFYIGAGVTHGRVAVHERVRKIFPALAESCMSVGSPQIRNIATLLGGNVVSAQPAADSSIALVALGARAQIVSSGGQRTELVENLYAGVGQSKVDPRREVLTGFILPLPVPESGNAFTRFAPREALALPIVSAAACITLAEGCIRQARICIGPVAVHPFRPLQAEQNLLGKRAEDNAALEEAAVIASQEAKPRDSLLRGSGKYRQALVRDLVYRALASAVKKATED